MESKYFLCKVLRFSETTNYLKLSKLFVEYFIIRKSMKVYAGQAKVSFKYVLSKKSKDT